VSPLDNVTDKDLIRELVKRGRLKQLQCGYAISHLLQNTEAANVSKRAMENDMIKRFGDQLDSSGAIIKQELEDGNLGATIFDHKLIVLLP
jgi:hypothetical protein